MDVVRQAKDRLGLSAAGIMTIDVNRRLSQNAVSADDDRVAEKWLSIHELGPTDSVWHKVYRSRNPAVLNKAAAKPGFERSSPIGLADTADTLLAVFLRLKDRINGILWATDKWATDKKAGAFDALDEAP